MTKQILSIAALWLGLSIMPAVAGEAEDKTAITAIIQAVAAGWENGDRTPFEAHYLDFEGARYVESGGQNEGLADLVDHHVVPEGDHLNELSLDFSNIEINLENDFAWAIADVKVHAVVKKDDSVIDRKGYETFLFRKIDDAWKVVHTHSSTR
jgi:ketosteroid isomerase-like protein